MLSNKLLFAVSCNTHSCRIYKGVVPSVVRPEDDISRIFNQCPILFLALPQRRFRLLALGDVAAKRYNA